VRRRPRVGASILTAGIVLWVGAILLAPRAMGSGGRLLPTGAAAIYAAGHFICHQRPDRCFLIDGRPMPVCARCAGLYAAAAAAAPLALLVGATSSSSRARRLLLVAAIPTVVTWAAEYAGLAHFSNAVRFSAALPLGCAAAWLVVSTVLEPPLHDKVP
jgi:uncharacterized membrane protein